MPPIYGAAGRNYDTGETPGVVGAFGDIRRLAK
jgi:hypothetical protein